MRGLTPKKKGSAVLPLHTTGDIRRGYSVAGWGFGASALWPAAGLSWGAGAMAIRAITFILNMQHIYFTPPTGRDSATVFML